jgi:pimeloyl-ACP methyl ester carboxylesterase
LHDPGSRPARLRHPWKRAAPRQGRELDDAPRFDWKSPVWRHWLDQLGRGNTLVRYDERGCGLSDREVEDLSLDAWVSDLETVVDAAGLDRFALLGISQGGAIALAYAVRHPERVTHVALYGAYARGRMKRDLSPHAIDEAEMLLSLIRIESPALSGAAVRSGRPWVDESRGSRPVSIPGVHRTLLRADRSRAPTGSLRVRRPGECGPPTR